MPSHTHVHDTRVVQCSCTASIEQRLLKKQEQAAEGELEGESVEARNQALMVLFSNHLCLELTALNFTTQRIIPFTDVLGIEHDDAGDRPVLVVSCRGITLHLAISPDIFEHVSKEVEYARLNSVDLSRITDGDKKSTALMDESTVKLSRISATSDEELIGDLYNRNRVSVSDGQSALADGAAARKSSANQTVASVMGKLSQAEWTQLMSGAEHFECKHRKTIIKEGETTKALYQLTHGTATVELHVKGRPQAVVVSRKVAGDIFGERSLLMGGGAKASVVVESETAGVIRLKHAHIQHLFTSSHPNLAGKFYYFIALDQARTHAQPPSAPKCLPLAARAILRTAPLSR